MFLQYSPVLKQTKPKNDENGTKENEAVTELSLAPFTANPKIEFNNVKLGSVVTKRLLILNPTDRDFNINVTSKIPEDLNFYLSWTDNFIAKGNKVILDLIWQPIKEESNRYSIVLSDGRMRRTVFLTFKSINPLKTIRKGKTFPKKQPFFRTSPGRKLPSGLKYTLPNTLITPSSTSHRDTFVINKENIPQTDGRETFTINEFPSSIKKRPKCDLEFDDSLENAITENFLIEDQHENNFETKLRSLTFNLTPTKVNFTPNCSSSVKKDTLNVSSTTYVKDNSFETYIKSNTSFENYVNQNFSSGTYVKESSIADLSNFSTTTTLYNNKHLITINEESTNSITLSNRKRKPSQTFSIIPKKRLSLEPCNNRIKSPCYNIDPFMNGHLFDAHYILQQQTCIEKWLNTILTPPAELDAITEVDAAKIWQECKTINTNVTVAAAPTKETVSINYHINNKLNLLRLKAREFYQQPDIVEILCKISNLIDLGRISIRKEKKIHLNVTLKGDLTKLILSYNPLWLRIGLETIYNENLLLQSNSDIKGLTHFLLERLFKCPFLLKKYKTIYSENYVNELNKFFLKKFLSLVYFLDRAKIQHLINHDPCLFCRNSEIKSSRDILLSLSREILASMGDITKYLKLCDYVVFHSQTKLNEFQYGITCLGMDLRDGVRLVRLLEIILLRNDLAQQLRVPAVSRLQKVHNMNIVFQALNDAGFKILCDINATHLVDGHKEKTLSFLWQIIYKFQTPLMEKKATIIQRWYRSLNITIKRRQLQKLHEKRKRAILIIENWYKRIKFVQKTNLFLNYWIEFQRNRAAIKIQTYFRMYICRKKYNMEKQLIINIQAYAKGWLLRNYYQKRIKAAIFLQHKYRAWKLMRNTREQYLEMKTVTVKMQAVFRAKKQRQIFISLKTSTIFIQRTFRANQMMKIQRAEFLNQKQAAICVQRWYRAQKAMILQRNQFIMLKKYTVKIQATFRAYKKRLLFISLKTSTIFIQRTFRANQLMKIQRVEFLKQKQAAIRIQQWYRAQKAMILQRNQFILLKVVTVKIQATFKANKQRQFFISLKTSTIFIQQRFRANKLMRIQRAAFLKQKQAAICIQQWYRARKAMILQRNQFILLKKITLKIQATFKANKQRQFFVSLKKSTTFIQQRFRANKLMKIQRNEFLNQKQAAICVQRWYRAQKAMILQRNQFILLKKITLKIQATFKANKQRQFFVSLKTSTTFIQQRFRANKLMKIQRAEFLDQKQAAICVQRWYKAQKAMIFQCNQFILLKTATVKIQATFRAYKQRQLFISLKTSTIFIQRTFRANQLMKIQRVEFLNQKQAAIRIQRWYRAQKAMIFQRDRYVKLKNAVQLIQDKFRAQHLMKLQRQQYVTLKTVTIFIQRKFRANQEHKKLIKQQQIIVQLQSYCRGYLIRSKYQDYFSDETREKRRVDNERKNAAIKIQAAYRSYRQRKQNDPALIEIAKRVRAANNNFKIENTLGYRMENSLTIIIHEFSTISQIIAALKQLEFITRRSALICEKTVHYMPQQLYMLLNATIRSLPEAEVCTLAAKILVNYCKLETTREKSFIEEYINDTITVMLHWCDKDNEVFISLCTLMWLFVHVNKFKRIICNLPNIRQRFQKIENLCKRKQSMVLKTGVKSVKSYFGPYKKLPLPTTTPDWGLDYKNKPHLFTHALHAFYSLDSILFNV